MEPKFKDIDHLINQIKVPSNKCRLETEKVILFLLHEFNHICNLNISYDLDSREWKQPKLRNMSMRLDISNRKPKIYIPDITEDKLKACPYNLTILGLFILLPGLQGHQNLIIINSKTQEIERFEPHGASVDYTKLDLDKILKEKWTQVLPNYKYIAPVDYCPVGPQVDDRNQRKHCNYGGYCVVWSILYGHLRLLNPDFSRQEVIQYLLSLDVRELYLRKYIAYIDSIITDQALKASVDLAESFSDVYLGQKAKNGEKQGYGVMKYGNGNIYEGQWDHNLIQGLGQMQYWYKGNSNLRRQYIPDVYRGQWDQNMKSGQGTMIYNSDRDMKMSFTKSDRPDLHKFGIIPDNYHDEVYTGNWLQNVYHGLGKLTDLKGNHYQGQWQWHPEADMYTIKGQIKYANGDVFKGYFIYDDFYKGRRHGAGKITFVDGTTKEGQWDQDRLTS